MSTTLDGDALFDERGLQIEIDSHGRARIERAICGLDGVLSIDLGQRTRAIRQRGLLHASGRAVMQTRTDLIAAFMDGGTHTLRTVDGQEYGNVRMDSFRRLSECTSGSGIVVEYEIAYTQLGA